MRLLSVFHGNMETIKAGILPAGTRWFKSPSELVGSISHEESEGRFDYDSEVVVVEVDEKQVPIRKDGYLFLLEDCPCGARIVKEVPFCFKGGPSNQELEKLLME